MGNRVALVSGVGPGLGAESALALARDGADIALVARTDAVMQGVARQVQALGRRALCCPADITDAEACRHAVTRIVDAFGRLDVLVNNAFYQGRLGSALTTDLDDWRRVIDVNVLGTLQMTRAAAPHLQRCGEAYVVMVNTLQAWKTEPGFGAYAASKAALESVTRTLAAELGPSGVRVNGVHPGMIMDDALRGFFRHLAAQENCTEQDIYTRYAATAALGYIPPSHEVAAIVAFLASEHARPITGQSLGVNAGCWFH